MRRLALACSVVVVALVGAPATAVGSTVTEAGATITAQAAPGERNRLGPRADRDGFYTFANDDPSFARIFAGAGCTQIQQDLGDIVDCPSSGVSKIEVDLLDQNDEGGGGGLAAAVIVHGGLGADTLGAFGHATVEGDDGPDLLESFQGPNVLEGGPGADDFLSAVEATNSVKRGGPGDDHFRNLRRVEDVSGGPDVDTLEVGNSDDAIISLDDQPNDGAGTPNGSNIRSDVEHVIGSTGDDDLSARSGSQTLEGGSGADRLDAGAGADTLSGGSGDDAIQARDGERDVVDCGPGQDRVVADGVDAVTNCEAVLLDQDQDGASTDTDCDDSNPGVHPGAVDIPDNGVDENCDNSQLSDPDRDRDGVQRPADCRDDRSDIHPGAIDIPQNGINEDCVDGDADFPRIASIPRATFKGVRGGFTKFKSLRIVNARAGSTIRLSCSGRGCKLRKRDRTIKVRRDRGSLNLMRRVGRVRLYRRTVFVVRVTQPRTIGALTRWRGRGPSTTECGLRPGVRKPQRCHKP